MSNKKGPWQLASAGGGMTSMARVIASFPATGLTTEQHGAYLLLLLDNWVSGALPDDDDVLARVAGLDAERWAQVRPVIAGYFQIADGQWVHARIEREREHAQAHAQASFEVGGE